MFILNIIEYYIEYHCCLKNRNACFVNVCVIAQHISLNAKSNSQIKILLLQYV